MEPVYCDRVQAPYVEGIMPFGRQWLPGLLVWQIISEMKLWRGAARRVCWLSTAPPRRCIAKGDSLHVE